VPSQTPQANTAAQRCSKKPFTVFIKKQRGLQRVTFLVDGKRQLVVRKVDQQKRFVFRVDPTKFKAGRHRIRARMTMRGGKSRVVPMRGFTSCAVSKCVSRRAFRIRVKNYPGETVVSAKVFVNGKRVRVVRGARLTAQVKLTGHPQGRFKVVVIAKTASGKTLKDVRRYKTCALKGKRPSRRP
jgi:hypothetical protein